jgi:prevent-host-death family protein
MKISVDEAQARFSDLLDLIAVGEEVLITDKGEPVAKLVPVLPTEQKSRKRQLGSSKGEFKIPDDFNDPLRKEIEDLFW